MSDSEYEDFANFTAEDFDQIDAAVLAALGPQTQTRPASPHSDGTSMYWDSSFDNAELAKFAEEIEASGPDILIELEDCPTDVLLGSLKNRGDAESENDGNKPLSDATSPYRRFRKKNTLSVSDLVGPAWCEVQFDYGLRQRRHRKLETRPTTFVSAHGQEIKVNTKVAKRNDKVLKAGKVVHKNLEREIKPIEIEIYATTEEERWALRLVNMLAAVESLLTIGFAREIPVFGMVHDQIVIGVIDELHRELKPEIPSFSARQGSPYCKPALGKRTRRTDSDSQHPRITLFMQNTPSKPSSRSSTPAHIPLPKYLLHISDSKTRQSMTLPSEDDALPARLQLMLYHRLLSGLVSSSFAFHFSKVWERLGLRPHARLGAKFLADAGLVLEQHDGIQMKCLDDLTAAWSTAVQRLDVEGVDKHMKLMYRTRAPRDKAWSKTNEKVSRDAGLSDAVQGSLKDADDFADPDLQRAIQRAIEASLKERCESVLLPSEAAESSKPRLAWVAQDLLLRSAHVEATGEDASDSRPSTPSDGSPESHIFGVKYFEVNDILLDDYVTSVLQWWYGQRAPQGVSLEHTKRCFSCEYSEDCEWRAAKAREALSKPAFGGPETQYF